MTNAALSEVNMHSYCIGHRLGAKGPAMLLVPFKAVKVE